MISDSSVALNMSKKIVSNNFVGVLLKHCISLGLKLFGEDIVYCKYCASVITGGFYRFICHLTGLENEEVCEGVSDEVKKEMLEILTTLQEISDNGGKRKGDDDDEMVVGRSRDRFKRRRLGSQDSADSKEILSEEARRAVARFFYNNVIPFEAVDSDEFITMCDLISRHGVGFNPPGFNDIKYKYLTEEVKLTNQVLEEHRAMWKITGCTIMVDGFTDMASRTILNLLVNSPKGTFFLKSIDASEILALPDKLFKMMDDIVEEVGEENVVQVVTENTPYYQAAGVMLMAKRTRLYWTPCATHSIQWILENCEDIPIHKETLEACQKIIFCIHLKNPLIALLRQFTKGIDIWKFGLTRCDSSYLTLCAIHENKGALIRMFTSEEWKSSEFAETGHGKFGEDVVLDKKFWKNVMICYEGIRLLLEVLDLAISIEERPTMGFIYEAMEKAKEKIQRRLSKGGIERESSMLLWKKIDEIWDTQLHSPLYAAGYFLNPQFHYSPGFRCDIKIKRDLQLCIARMVADPVERSKIEIQLDDFENQANQFGHPTAVITADDEIPPIWWASSVNGLPELQSFAIRVLSLTCSSYWGNRHADAFKMVHAKIFKEKILKIDDVAFVMANSKLAEKMRASVELNLNDNGDVEGIDGADLHDEDANEDEGEDEDRDGDEDGDADEDADEN